MHVIDINASIGKRVSEDARHGIRALSEDLDRHRVACAAVHHGEAVGPDRLLYGSAAPQRPMQKSLNQVLEAESSHEGQDRHPRGQRDAPAGHRGRLAGRPVLFMPRAPEDAPAERDLAREFPTLPIVHAHAFDADWAAVVKDAPNVHVEFCLSRPSHHDVRYVLDILGRERVLFGSDQTLLGLGAAVGLYLDARMSERERTLVLSGNARRLYGIEG